MRRDVTEIRSFYGTPLGQTATRLIGARLSDAWGPLTGQDVLGLGYAAPWLDEMREARRALCAMPFAQGAEAWPRAVRSRTTLVDELALPFATGVFDRILAVHAIEEATDPLALVRELGRVLKPSGRLVLVVAGRGGLWAGSEKTPFGDGRPYSRGQLERLVRDAELEPFAWSQALFCPPWGRLTGLADALEPWGARLMPGAAGVVLLEAVKIQLALRPRTAAAPVPARRRQTLAPQPAGLVPTVRRNVEIGDEHD
ncbi:MAG: methyltransferase domain-containing protein [Caulobacterales bacterium]|nr:methyltransferase domain-containing protein [Caulobacterales bacterium]